MSFVELILGLPLESKRSWFDGISSLLDSDYDSCLIIHPLSIVPNTPFAHPAYVEKYDLRYTATRSPAQGFCYGTECPEEREEICIGSSTMSSDEWIDCYYYGKSLVGAYYFHGLSYYVVQFLKRKKGIPSGYFFEKLLDYCKVSSGFLGTEYRDMTDALKQTLFDLRPWGRKIFGDSDMYWSDQAASAMIAIQNHDAFYNDIGDFTRSICDDIEDQQIRDLMKFNESMLEMPGVSYPLTETFNYNWFEFFEGKQELLQKETRYIFFGENWKGVQDHALKVYWFGRKSRRCFVNEVKNANL